MELQDPLVYNAIQKGIDIVNQEATSNAQKIQKWAILDKDFSMFGGELGERPGELWPWLLEAGPQLVQGHVASETCPILGARGSVEPAGDTYRDAGSSIGLVPSSSLLPRAATPLPLGIKAKLLTMVPCELSPDLS